MSNCWICQVEPGSHAASRHQGACVKCYERLRKRHGYKQWAEVAREAIKMGNRGSLLGWAMCRCCGVQRVSPVLSETLVCQDCRGKEGASVKVTEAQKMARAVSYETQRKHERDAERLKRNAARIANARERKLQLVVRKSGGPSSAEAYALALARKDPSRRVIPVPVGDPLSGYTLLFEPYLDRKGLVQVRQLSDNAKGA